MGFHCAACREEFQTRSLVYKHKKACVATRTCPVCKTLFKTYRELPVHIRQVHPNENIPCTVEGCRTVFKSYNGMNVHLMQFHIEKNIPCTFEGCRTVFKAKNELNAHLKRVHTEKNIPCTFEGCQSLFKNENGLKAHLKHIHSGIIIPCIFEGCKSIFKNKFELQTHLKRDHSEKTIACTENIPCTVEGCESLFQTKRDLKHHIEQIHTEEISCTVEGCLFLFENENQRQDHINSYHANDVQCTVAGCSRRLKSERAMQNHIRDTHPDGSVNICICGMIFTNSRKYRNHHHRCLNRKIYCCEDREDCLVFYRNLESYNQHRLISDGIEDWAHPDQATKFKLHSSHLDYKPTEEKLEQETKLFEDAGKITFGLYELKQIVDDADPELADLKDINLIQLVQRNVRLRGISQKLLDVLYYPAETDNLDNYLKWETDFIFAELVQDARNSTFFKTKMLPIAKNFIKNHKLIKHGMSAHMEDREEQIIRERRAQDSLSLEFLVICYIRDALLAAAFEKAFLYELLLEALTDEENQNAVRYERIFLEKGVVDRLRKPRQDYAIYITTQDIEEIAGLASTAIKVAPKHTFNHLNRPVQERYMSKGLRLSGVESNDPTPAKRPRLDP